MIELDYLHWAASDLDDGTAAMAPPPSCTPLEFSVLHPDPEPLAAICAAPVVPVAVKRALRPGFAATLESPRGSLLVTSP